MSQVLTMKDDKKKEKEAPQAIAKRPSAVLEEVPIVDVRILNKARKIEGLPPVGEDFAKALRKKREIDVEQERNILKKAREIENLFDIEDSVVLYKKSRDAIKRKLKNGKRITEAEQEKRYHRFEKLRSLVNTYYHEKAVSLNKLRSMSTEELERINGLASFVILDDTSNLEAKQQHLLTPKYETQVTCALQQAFNSVAKEFFSS